MSVRGIESFLEGDAATACEEERVGAFGNDFVPREEAAKHFCRRLVLGPNSHGGFQKGVG